MQKGNLVLIIIVFLLIAGGILLVLNNPSDESLVSDNLGVNTESQCDFKEMTFYYSNSCGWCQKVENEGIIEKIDKLGVKVNKVDANIGPIKHQFRGVPTFVINEKVYSGYRTFEQLKEILGC